MPGVGDIRQSTQPKARILAAVATLRSATGSVATTASLDVVREREHVAYAKAVDEVALALAQQPLPRLQRLPGGTDGGRFLYDDSWMHDKVTLREVDRRGGSITLLPGVASGLARLSGLLRPTLEMFWVDDVVRMNAALRDERVDLAGHLFGRERVGLGKVREAYYDEFGPRCFYCETGLGAASPIDHVLPWSRVVLDGLANLVPACRPCNSSKSSALPVAVHVTRALDRGPEVLSRIGADIGWPVQWERTAGAARGLYLSAQAGTPLWESRSGYAVVDRTWPGEPWLRVEAWRHGAPSG